MEKLLNSYERQSMKMCMLKHEKLFKEQVLELHRLYQLQKLLTEHKKINNSSQGRDGVLEIELTLGSARYRTSRKDETPPNSDAGPSLSSSSFCGKITTKTHIRADRKAESTGQHWELIQLPTMHSNIQRRKLGYDTDQQETLNQSPWPFRVLSLNMT